MNFVRMLVLGEESNVRQILHHGRIHLIRCVWPVADFNKAIDLDPKYALAYDNRGSAYATKSNLDQAIADYNTAIDLDAKYAKAYHNRGLVYLQKGLKPQAIADFETYLRLEPNASERARVEQWLRDLKGQ
jgi:tetratricopeptide (TPR) repeat protein